MYRLIEEQLEKFSDKTAIVYQNKNYSYQWIDHYTKAMAAFIHDKKYKTFSFCTLNSPLNIIAYLASSLSGCHCLPVNPRYTSFELSELMAEFKPDVLFIEEERVTAALEITAKANKISIYSINTGNAMQGELWDQLDKYTGISKTFSTDPDKTFVYHLTSGAMGHAKFCRHDSQQLYRYAHNRAVDMGFVSTDVLLVSLSVNHAFAFSYQVLPALALGLTMYIHDKFDEKALFETITTAFVTSIAMLPSMAYFLSLYASKQQPFQHNLRYSLVAGDAVPSAFSSKFKQIFSVDLYQGIGMTEVFGYAQNTPEHFNVLSSGKLFDHVDLEIRDNNGHTLETGKTGDVYISNEATLSCYHLQPELTGKELAGGWVNTGDVGYVDENRYFYFLGRKKQIIIRGGSNISPVEIESIFYLHPHVLQAAVVGKKNEIWGQVIWAYLIVDDAFSGDINALYEHCKGYLSEYKQPENIVCVDALPENATGKIDRFQLQAMANATEKEVNSK